MDPRTEATDVRILLSSGEGVRISWKDGHRSSYSFAYLRESCPCAACTEPAHEPVSDLPMYKEKPRAVKAEAVGHYAIRFKFSDGHDTGIYSFEHLRGICPCDECTGSGKPNS